MNKIPGILTTVLVIGFFLGCTEKSPFIVQNRVDLSPLTIESSKANDLLTINSLCILPPTIHRQINKLSTDEVKRVLIDAAKSELAMELLSINVAQNENTKKLGCDGVLQTDISKFIEREGSTLGSEAGAQLTFSFEIIRSSDSKKIWGASYAFKDKALSEDVIAFGKGVANKGGIGWSSASRMLRNGFIQGLRELNSQRTDTFLKR